MQVREVTAWLVFGAIAFVMIRYVGHFRRRPSPAPVVVIAPHTEWPVVIDPTLITPEMEAEYAAQEPPPPTNRQQRRAQARREWRKYHTAAEWPGVPRKKRRWRWLAESTWGPPPWERSA